MSCPAKRIYTIGISLKDLGMLAKHDLLEDKFPALYRCVAENIYNKYVNSLNRLLMEYGNSVYDMDIFAELRKNTLLDHLTLVKLFTDVAKPEHPERCELAQSEISILIDYIINTDKAEYNRSIVRQLIDKIKKILEIDDIVFYTMYNNLA